MRISASTHPGPWQVFRDGEELKNVYALDTVTAQWEGYVTPFSIAAGELQRETHQARAITVNGWRVDIWTKDLPPEVPPPVWDGRKVDADHAMAAVRALCG